MRRGRTVATIAPVRRGTGADLHRIFAEHPLDDEFGADIADTLRFVDQSPRNPWSD